MDSKKLKDLTKLMGEAIEEMRTLEARAERLNAELETVHREIEKLYEVIHMSPENLPEDDEEPESEELDDLPEETDPEQFLIAFLKANPNSPRKDIDESGILNLIDSYQLKLLLSNLKRRGFITNDGGKRGALWSVAK